LLGSILIGAYQLGSAGAPAAQPAALNAAGYALVYRPGLGLIWTQYSDEPPPAEFSLVYRPGLAFIWQQYGGTAAGASIWECGGTSGAVFEAAGETQLWWRADGDAVTTWFLQADLISGFSATGASTCEFLFKAAGGFVAQGRSACTFVADEPSPAYGFRADGKGQCRFFAAIGTGDGCLTPPDTPVTEGIFPNFVY
jgi:hypothetical protein